MLHISEHLAPGFDAMEKHLREERRKWLLALLDMYSLRNQAKPGVMQDQHHYDWIRQNVDLAKAKLFMLRQLTRDYEDDL